ncbi:hypothetical protein PTSG_12768 [Salpingoeca rosetta]|uniref:Tubulin-tyrosine ligase n=1 Tax=Salpingoeca rosetta (strain ATCC 50818 / BSB-021) TaxID=946362 RepID=F2UKC2_SALR5|nr:uncharacterized protein PTSG_12768 [Salpingoeca rosetta]EGD77571.1 hypothetical protein PTSG_12768 [Salpingoeca rosetta]|eukprot:XP_004990459.1 hypothetical protein PTSG_12768 [Salpingoeca rosetta]
MRRKGRWYAVRVRRIVVVVVVTVLWWWWWSSSSSSSDQGQRQQQGEMVCRYEPYGANERRHVGYAGTGAQVCLKQLGCTSFVGGRAPPLWRVLWTFKHQPHLPCEATQAPHQRQRRFVNHCFHNPINNIAGRKSHQYTLYDGMRAAYGRDLYHAYMPDTWIMPRDAHRVMTMLRHEQQQQPHNNTRSAFIFKPDLGSRAQGIKIFTPGDSDHEQLARTLQAEGVVQRYVDNPFLLQGHKHHLRLYLVTTSVSPVHAFLYKDGLYLPASSPYNRNDIWQTASHLTNAAVSKHANKCKTSNQASDSSFSPECPQPLHKYWQHAEVGEANTHTVMQDVKAILRRVVMSSPTIRSRHLPPCGLDCFEIHGVDILLTTASGRLKPVLLEVNHSPELYTPQHPTNDAVHMRLLRHTRTLLMLDEQDDTWHVLQQCATAEEMKSCAHQPSAALCNDDSVLRLLWHCRQQRHTQFTDVMLACPPHTMEPPFQQWSSPHMHTLCCCHYNPAPATP